MQFILYNFGVNKIGARTDESPDDSATPSSSDPERAINETANPKRQQSKIWQERQAGTGINFLRLGFRIVSEDVEEGFRQVGMHVYGDVLP